MKLLVCDVEGTIFKVKQRIDGTNYASTMWQPIALALGEEAINDEKETHRKHERGEYKNYIEWMQDTIRIHIKYGLKRDVFEGIANSAEYNLGVAKFFDKLDRESYIPILISGGFQSLSKRAQVDFNIEHSFAACDYYFSNNGDFAGYNLLPSDFKGKYNFVKIMLKEYGLSENDWVFIGDGKNDIHIAGKAPMSIGMNADDELKKVTTYNVNNFSDILKYL